MSAIEQKDANRKTCFINMPCLKTKIFWGPIAIINENPSNKPVNRGSIINRIIVCIYVTKWTELSNIERVKFLASRGSCN